MKVRVEAVCELLLNGYTRAYILDYAEDHWKVAERQVDEYIALATLKIEEITTNSAENCLAIITSNLWSLYRRWVKREPGNARMILLDLAKLRGLDRIQLDIKVDRPLKDLSNEELAKAIADHA